MSFKDDVKSTRSHTARIRLALSDLPKAIAHEGWNASSDKENLRDILQEIIGSAVAIAELTEVEL